MKNDGVPNWAYTIAHIGGILFVLVIALVLIFIFVTIICDSIADNKAVLDARETESHFKTVEEMQDAYKQGY